MTSRPAEIEQWSNARLIHPLSRRLAQVFIGLGFTANMVSVTGLALIFAAAIIFATRPGTWWLLPGSLFLFLSHVLDGADGIVARTTGTASRFGEIIDGVCDYLGYGALYLALGSLLWASNGPGFAIAAVVVTTLSHVAQANFYETRRRQYCYRVYGTAWIGGGGQIPAEAPGLLKGLAKLFLGISAAISGENPAVIREITSHPARIAEFKSMRRGLLKKMAPLSQNVKSLAFALAMLAGWAAGYVIFVVVLLNAALLALRFEERQQDSAFVTAG